MSTFSRITRNFFCAMIFFLLSSTSMSANPLTPSLFKLLDLMQVEHDGTLASIVEATQEKWIRPSGKERWQVPDLPPELKPQVLQLVGEMGFLEEIKPSKATYDYCLVFGATQKAMQVRFNYLIHLWESGVSFKEVVILVSQRPLDVTIEPLASSGFKTETDVAKYLWEIAALPDALRSLPLTVVDVPMITLNGSTRRPNTTDTIVAWLQLNPTPGSLLFISNQPYCAYQNAIATSCLGADFTLETVGPMANPQFQNGAVLLDTVARWLYAEWQLERGVSGL